MCILLMLLMVIVLERELAKEALVRVARAECDSEDNSPHHLWQTPNVKRL